MKFKVGDKVLITQPPGGAEDHTEYVGRVGMVVHVHHSDSGLYDVEVEGLPHVFMYRPFRLAMPTPCNILAVKLGAKL